MTKKIKKYSHTFVVCAYQKCKYLEECVKSLKNQTVLGNFVLDSISSITINATKNSVIEGAINSEKTAKT